MTITTQFCQHIAEQHVKWHSPTTEKQGIISRVVTATMKLFYESIAQLLKFTSKTNYIKFTAFQRNILQKEAQRLQTEAEEKEFQSIEQAYQQAIKVRKVFAEIHGNHENFQQTKEEWQSAIDALGTKLEEVNPHALRRFMALHDNFSEDLNKTDEDPNYEYQSDVDEIVKVGLAKRYQETIENLATLYTQVCVHECDLAYSKSQENAPELIEHKTQRLNTLYTDYRSAYAEIFSGALVTPEENKEFNKLITLDAARRRAQSEPTPQNCEILKEMENTIHKELAEKMYTYAFYHYTEINEELESLNSLEFPTEAEKERKADLNEQKMQVTKQLDLCRHFLPEEYRDDKWKNVKSYILGTTVLCLTSWLSLSFFRAYTREAPQ